MEIQQILPVYWRSSSPPLLPAGGPHPTEPVHGGGFQCSNLFFLISIRTWMNCHGSGSKFMKFLFYFESNLPFWFSWLVSAVSDYPPARFPFSVISLLTFEAYLSSVFTYFLCLTGLFSVKFSFSPQVFCICLSLQLLFLLPVSLDSALFWKSKNTICIHIYIFIYIYTHTHTHTHTHNIVHP